MRGGVDEQGHLAGAFDFAGQQALVMGAGARDAPGDDFAALGDEVAQDVGTLVVQGQFLIGAETAELAARGKFLFKGHLGNLPGHFVGQLDGHEFEDAVGDPDIALQFGHQRGRSVVDQTHVIAAHQLVHRIGQITHAPVIHFRHDAPFALDNRHKGVQDALAVFGGKLR